ncbi:MAG: hypothetical protein IJ833_07915 [Lachnospiraceae bacterium]|nr:hypothetical protein [Lachnospiraceae bacterium]
MIEMIITVGIIAVLTGSIAVVFPQWLRQYVSLRQIAEATNMVDVMASGIKEELQFSKNRTWDEEGLHYVRDIRMGDFPLNEDECTINYDEAANTLTVVGRPEIFGTVFDADFYGEMTATVVVENETRTRDNKNFLAVDIEIRNAEGQLMSSEKIAVNLYNQ